MDLKVKCDDAELRKGHLHITASLSSAALTPANLVEIVNGVRNGFVDERGIRHQPITRLTLCQVKFPRNNAAFTAFINGLLGERHFIDLDFRGISTSSPPLSPVNTRILANAVGQAAHLRRLVVNVPERLESSQQLAEMVRANNSLTHFTTDLTDDVYRFGVTKAVLETHNALTEVSLLHSEKPEDQHLQGTAIVRDRDLLVRFQFEDTIRYTNPGAAAGAAGAAAAAASSDEDGTGAIYSPYSDEPYYAQMTAADLRAAAAPAGDASAAATPAPVPKAPIAPRSPRSRRVGRLTVSAGAGAQDAGAARQAGLMPVPKVGQRRSAEHPPEAEEQREIARPRTG